MWVAYRAKPCSIRPRRQELTHGAVPAEFWESMSHDLRSDEPQGQGGGSMGKGVSSLVKAKEFQLEGHCPVTWRLPGGSD